MIEIAKNSEHGWDQLIQPLTQLAMLLIDFASSQGFAASRPTTIAADNTGKSLMMIVIYRIKRGRDLISLIIFLLLLVCPPPVINKNKHSPMDNVISLGKDILIKMFEVKKKKDTSQLFTCTI